MQGFGKSDILRNYRLNPRVYNHPALILPGVVGWFEAEDLAPVGAGNPVATWANRIAGAGDFAQPSSGNRPIFNTYDGFPGIGYAAGSQYISANLNLHQRATLFIVAHYQAAATDWNGFLYMYGSSYCYNINMRYQSFLGIQGCSSNQRGFTADFAAINQRVLYTWDLQAGTIIPNHFRLNGVEHTSEMTWFNGDSPATMDTMSVNLGTASYAGAARVSSLLIAAGTPLTAAQIQATETFYMAKYGLR